jgi:hypothetical protein
MTPEQRKTMQREAKELRKIAWPIRYTDPVRALDLRLRANALDVVVAIFG